MMRTRMTRMRTSDSNNGKDTNTTNNNNDKMTRTTRTRHENTTIKNRTRTMRDDNDEG